MKYSVKEIYYTLQGEGANAGKPAVFCRFTGCNLWSGREEDRAAAVCQFCDTQFVGADGPGGGVFQSALELASAVAAMWPESWNANKLVVCTGGEPLLQLDEATVEALHDEGFEVAVETNGTRLPPPGIDWICVSPKANAECILRTGNELKLVYPQVGGDPARYEDFDFDRFFLQPMDGLSQEQNTKLAAQYCLEHPRWELSIQTHKLIGLP
ncbi:7-carboxy-7-deazaguanine synthase [Allorhodopirellula solitaria]|uniref:7-carboxy-7-deazaguanine synthase n=1 Tax=Allorhodopirellula solitaria TaxID=2527987 RepID=A0A5C5WQE0_9BACT|nr:7-carboxy-7-deazaguanine synthase [Allorhodopirellula solitaria]TWT52002.1 7-carboxy-7-deazaguanine synthase [Allorhodopirellula solitaria]